MVYKEYTSSVHRNSACLQGMAHEREPVGKWHILCSRLLRDIATWKSDFQKIFRTYLRLWANPACRSAKKRRSSSCVVKFLREMPQMVSTAESTFGAGLKAPARNGKFIFWLSVCFYRKRQYGFFFARAILSATSFCTKSVIELGCLSAPRNILNISPVK